MIIATLNESPRDTRVAITPQVVKHYEKLGLSVHCESQAGIAAGFSDNDYEAVHAHIEKAKARPSWLPQVNLLACVQEPEPKTLSGLPEGSLVIAPISNQADNPLITWACSQRVSLFSMNLIPRITRAQNMDSLSSQANLAGYRAVLEAVSHYQRAIPMMMTAAGMIHPAKILILGAGVAGLQAIATARRLGAVVYVFDVRKAAKEQVESLGAEFIEVDEQEDNETQGGYARETTAAYQAKQAEKIAEYAKLADIIICTALIPGRKAPVLLSQIMVENMKSGSVIVDLATYTGGNCELSEMDKVIKHQGVTIVGYGNMAGFISATASELYANNVLHLVRLLTPDGSNLIFDEKDEIIKQALICHNGQYLPFQESKENAHG